MVHVLLSNSNGLPHLISYRLGKLFDITETASFAKNPGVKTKDIGSKLLFRYSSSTAAQTTAIASIPGPALEGAGCTRS